MKGLKNITIDRAVLWRALEALRPQTAPSGAKRDAAFEELRAALAAQPQTLDEAMAVPRAMAQAYENGYNAALANGPAWHDVPTVPGIWLCDEGDICYEWTAHSIEILDQFEPGEGFRWFGPIPPDGDTK